jgi:hypothetical protein
MAESIDTGDRNREAVLLSVLDTAKYPLITFERLKSKDSMSISSTNASGEISQSETSRERSRWTLSSSAE